MKKTICYLLIIAILIAGLFTLTGCKKSKDDSVSETKNENSTSQTSSVDLESHILSLELDEDEYIQVKVDYPKSDDIKITPGDDEYNVTITNEKKNYALKLSLGDEVEDTYYEEQDADKEEDGYTESKFADNDGYYYLFGNSTVMGNVLIDTQTSNDYKFVFFELSPVEGEVDALPLFKDTEVQDILSSFGFRYKTAEDENV